VGAELEAQMKLHKIHAISDDTVLLVQKNLSGYSIIAKMSLSVAIKYSFPSTFISFGPYFENKTLSPSFTDIATTFPSFVFLPGPVAKTFHCSDFSFSAVSGKKIPPRDFSSSFITSIKI